MAIDLTPDQRELGMANYQNTVDGLSRRGFMKSFAVAAGAAAVVTPALYFGYESMEGKPVKAALIGGGDEGGVLVGEHNPDYLQFVAVCDIRPANMDRIFAGDPKVPLRKGFRKVYGQNCDKQAIGQHYIAKFDDYDAFLAELKRNKDIEAVVIALPLSWHAKASIDCMKIGQERGKPVHVLCEKLMAWNVDQCKAMIKTAKDTGSILSIGHQRHYSMLYAHAQEVVKANVLGDIKHIRALWHRNNSWPFVADTAAGALATNVTQPVFRDGWFNPIYKSEYEALEKIASKYHYDSVEQLIRWRIYNETGGGLMAELGSHQLDACSIFLGKVHPIAVTGVGHKSFYGGLVDASDDKKVKRGNDREVDDHVFVTYEFPGKNYANDKNDIVVVSYSSISTNQFEAYGECLMGTRGTMIVEGEKSVMLYTEQEPGKKGTPKSLAVGVSSTGKDKPALESGSTWGGPATGATPSAGPAGAAGTTVSRGYREEMEDFAYCIRLWQQKLGYDKDASGKQQRLPRCHGEVAMADAIIALTANKAMKTHQRIAFKESWFDAAANEVPDGDTKPKVPVS